MKQKRVRCDECGFLALRTWPNRQLVEADLEYRQQVSTPGYGDIREYEDIPQCFVRKKNLKRELSKIATHKDKIESKDILTIIQKKRLCNRFTKWFQGFTPKEHLEMLDRNNWRIWQIKESRSNRRWRIIEALILFAMACVFLLLGYFLGN